MAAEGLFKYSAFDLILSANLPIPGLVPIPTESAIDVTVHIGISAEAVGRIACSSEELWHVSAYQDAAGVPIRRIKWLAQAGFFRIEYCDGAVFWLDRCGREVWTWWPEELSVEDMATYLLGPILGVLLRLRGHTCLHASAVAVDDASAVAFVGPGGAGKSTIGAILAECGHSVLTDDVVALSWSNGTCSVPPAYPHLSLWPDSAALIYGPSANLPRFIPGWEKRRLSLQDGLRFGTRVLPLRKIYMLAERISEGKPEIEDMSGRPAIMALVGNTYGSYILDVPMRAKELRELGEVVRKVPVAKLSVQQDLTLAKHLSKQIREDVTRSTR